MLRSSAVRVALTLLLAFAAAQLCVWLHTPLPWVIGPLLATAAAAMCGAPARSWVRLRNAGQWTIGTALGLYFTPQVTALVASLWWAVVLGTLWTLALGWAFGRWLHRGHAARMGVSERAQRATSYFGGAMGGASEMTLLAEREGARTDLVAGAHSLRLAMVTLLIPFALTFSGLKGVDLTPPGPREVHWAGLAVLALATGAGAWLMVRAGRTNPWFTGALLVAMGTAMAGITLSAIPTPMVNAAQLFIGVSLGVRFDARFIHAAPSWLASVAIGTLAMIVACALFAWGLSHATGLPLATMVLGTSPGGIAEMTITAKVLALGVPVVTAFQVSRLVAVLILVGPIYRRLYGAA